MNDEKKEGVKTFLNKIKTDKRIKIIVLIVVLSVFALFLFFSLFSSNEKSLETDENYVSTLENKLENVLSKISGAGRVSVMITVESGMETVLATKTNVTESNGKKVTEETPIIVNGKTVVLKENFPKIVGVLIIAEGANNFGVLRKIQDATLSVLDVDLKQVEILSMK